MTIKEVATKVVFETGTLAISSGLGFVNGCLSGRKASFPGMYLSGGVLAFTYVAEHALKHFIAAMSVKYDWKLSSYFCLNLLNGVVLQVAAAVALFALGIFNGSALASWVIFELVRAVVIGGGTILYWNFQDVSWSDSYVKFNEASEKSKERFKEYVYKKAEEEFGRGKRWLCAAFTSG